VVKVAAFERAVRFHLAASRCNAYALKGAEMASMQQAIGRLSTYRQEGLLGSKQLLAKAAMEAKSYMF
jgi:hypothetical protein